MCQWRFTGGGHYLESQLGYTCTRTQDHINYATEAGMGAPTIPPLTRGRSSNKQVSCSISTSWPVRSGSYSSTMYHWWPWEHHPITFWSSKIHDLQCTHLQCHEELRHETKEDGKVSLLREQAPPQAAIHLFLHRIIRVLQLHCILCLWQNSSLPISDAPISPFRNRYWYWYFGINIWLTHTDADTVNFLCISVCVCTLQIESLL